MLDVGDQIVAMIDELEASPRASRKGLTPRFLDDEFSVDLLSGTGEVVSKPAPSGQLATLMNSPPLDGQLKDLDADAALPDTRPAGGLMHSTNGSLVERMAARAGFSVPKLSMPPVAHMVIDGSPHPDLQSPLLTIPPGLSPTMLLDSPVFLCNSMVQASPTTGKFSFLQDESASRKLDENESRAVEDFSEGFAFKPPMESKSLVFSSAEKDSSSIDQVPSLPEPDVHAKPEIILPAAQGINLWSNQNKSEFHLQSAFENPAASHDVNNELVDDKPAEECKLKGDCSAMAIGAPAEDGYTWRKYGQKQVKHSEYPRSYYKCTHPNCQVKKKVERSHEGHVTEIIYKGTHNHPKPPQNRRNGLIIPLSDGPMEGTDNQLEPKAVWPGNGDSLEATSSPSVPAELCDSSASMQVPEGAHLESPEAVDVTSAPLVDEEGDRETRGSMSEGGDGEEDELESKRRKLESCAADMGAASRAVREPRVVIQTTSEVDILDDGYRWRKYGQKVVKGNPNPRSYYKCTNPGCSVRKHVERASHDVKSVITAYEGKHNHEVPAARNSGHPSSASGAPATTAVPQAHPVHQRRPEPPQESLARLHSCALQPLGAFSLPTREPLGPASSFSFGMVQLQNLPPGPGLGHINPMKMPMLSPPPMPSYLTVHQPPIMVPKGELKEEPASDANLALSAVGGGGGGGALVYRQMMTSRLPLGRQM